MYECNNPEAPLLQSCNEPVTIFPLFYATLQRGYSYFTQWRIMLTQKKADAIMILKSRQDYIPVLKSKLCELDYVNRQA